MLLIAGNTLIITTDKTLIGNNIRGIGILVVLIGVIFLIMGIRQGKKSNK